MVEVLHGEWWNPDASGSRVAGELRLDAGTATLNLFNVLVDLEPDTVWNEAVWVPLIHGQTADGQRFTLLDSMLTADSSDGRIARQQFRPQATLRGALLDQDDLEFDRMLLDLARLETFADYPRVELDTDVDDHGWRQRVELRGHRTEHLQGRLDDATVSLVSTPQHGGGGQDSTLDLDLSFDVEPDRLQPWEWFVDRPASVLSDLVTLALTVPAAIRSIRLHSVAGTRGPDRVWVDLLLAYRQPRTNQDAGQPLASFQRLFTARDLTEDVIGRWSELNDRMGSVIPLTFAPMYAPFIYGEHRFTSIAQAAEGIHDVLCDATDLPIAEHRARVDAVLAADIPGEHRRWVEAVLSNANNVPYRDKVERLLAACRPVGESIDPAWLADRVAKTRNPLSHGALRRNGMLDHEARHWVGELLTFAIAWHLLVELGFEADDASNRVSRHADFRHAINEIRDT